jgi:hypothetical protein
MIHAVAEYFVIFFPIYFYSSGQIFKTVFVHMLSSQVSRASNLLEKFLSLDIMELYQRVLAEIAFLTLKLILHMDDPFKG